MMLLNEIQAFFISSCFFELTFLKSNSITFRFSLTERHTTYQTVEFFWLYLQNSKRNESKYMKYRKQPLRGFLQNRFYDTFNLADF